MSMADRASIVDRIRKCLALSRSANEHEAAVAMAKAQALMREYDISEGELSFADIEEKSAKGNGAVRAPIWEAALALTCSRTFGCETFMFMDRRAGKPIWKFVGLNPAASLAAYAFCVLHRQLKRDRVTYIRKHLKRCRQATQRRRADSFCEGWVSSVVAKVHRLNVPSETRSLVNAYMEHHYKAMREFKPTDRAQGKHSEDFFSGRSTGDLAELNHGVGGDQTRHKVIGTDVGGAA